MARTIVSIEPGLEESWSMRLLKAPLHIDDARRPIPFTCIPDSMPSWSDPEAVKLHGQKLLGELENHPAIKKALDAALGTPPGDTQPVYFHLLEGDAEQLCWEALYAEGKRFLGLDPRWPIGRIADSVVDRQVTPRDFSPPLRITAVLSAMNRNAAEQWRALRNAAAAVRANGLPVELSAFVGEQPLLDEIRAEINGGLQGVTVAPMPDRTMGLQDALWEIQPHVLHFFCHGSASHGVPRLEMATLLDWLAGNATGSLKVSIDDLMGMPALADCWLVVLNCCESGRAEENMHSMAHALVANVVPAAVGTLEPFDESDANELCLGFYPQLLKEFARTLHRDHAHGKLIELEWANALRAARKGLSEKHENDPCNHRQWALPVLYARPEPFYVRMEAGAAPPAEPEDLRAWERRAEVVAGHLKALPPDTDIEVREALLGILDGAPDWLKPDPFGEFGPVETSKPVEEPAPV